MVRGLPSNPLYAKKVRLFEMTKARKESMMDDIIKKFGYEDNRTIAFCGMCENPEVSDFSINEVYEDFMSL